MTDTIFNIENTEWEDGSSLLILGQRPALHDSINVKHPKLFDLYKLQKSIDWQEDEIDLEQSRMDFESCPKSISEIMMMNLSWQWEIDSIASRTFAVLLAPFITNSEFWSAIQKNSEIETLHALTYSEIIRQCRVDTKTIIESILKNEQITDRSPHLVDALLDLQRAGAEYTLGLIPNDQNLFNRVFKGIIAMYILERLQFMTSFAATFAIGEQGYMIGICKSVQKISIDELTCHCEVLKYVIMWTLANDPRGRIFKNECMDDIILFKKEGKKKDMRFNKNMFSEGRKMVGLNYAVMNEWYDYNEYFVDLTLGLRDEDPTIKNPLKFMENWFDIDKSQSAPQEQDNNNYVKNTANQDISDSEIFEF